MVMTGMMMDAKEMVLEDLLDKSTTKAWVTGN
jgi:hypothetical protein